MLPEGDKITRMYIQTAKLEAGHVYIPLQASWLDDFRREVLQFPYGRHDDQIDSLSQYLGWETPAQPGEGRFMFAYNGIDNDPSAPWNISSF
jgi:phage terminase large subunit-like protein